MNDISFYKLGAERLADEVGVLIQTGRLDARSPAGDALCDFRNGNPRSDNSDRVAAMERAIKFSKHDVDGNKFDDEGYFCDPQDGLNPDVWWYRCPIYGKGSTKEDAFRNWTLDLSFVYPLHGEFTTDNVAKVAEAIAQARPALPNYHWSEYRVEAMAAIAAMASTVELPPKFRPHVDTGYAQAYNEALDRVHSALDKAGIPWKERE